MSTRNERMKRYAHMLANARYDMGYSQEYMANALGKTKKTIHNWETGKSFPNSFEMCDWFYVLGMNPTPYFLEFCNEETMYRISAADNDKRIMKALAELIPNLPHNYSRALMYLLYGSWNGDPESVLQMMLAYAHLPLHCRTIIASSICDIYEMFEMRDGLKDTEHIMPNMNLLRKAVENGKEAVSRGADGYQMSSPTSKSFKTNDKKDSEIQDMLKHI